MEKKVLLVADDDDMSRSIIRKYFSDYYDVLEATNGKEALDLIHKRDIDIVILDIVMPIMDGFEVLQTVKVDEKYSDVRILVATSIQEKTERRALELGADDIVFKPYDPIVIKKRIDNLMTMQEQKRELEVALVAAELANQAKTDFLSRISHDMRTPLNGILGITTLLKDNVNDKHTYEDLLQLEMSGKYLLNLINDTLDVNKIEVGKLELHPGVYDGRTTINNIINLIKPNMERKNIKFIINTDNIQYTMLYVDMGRIQQIIMNILGNAVKFTPEGGTIEARIRNIYNDGSLIKDEITISDNGIGMADDFLPHIFEPFKQENPGSTGNTTGTGLGMTITKQIIELMGGNIEVSSELGHGTTFRIILPMQIASSKQITNWKDSKNLNVNTYSFEGKRILLCEDHPLNAQIASRLLERKGIIVDIAKNGEIGLQMYQESPLDYYDIILMDIRMPVLDGLQTSEAIRSLNRKDAHRIPIIAMTANAFNEDIIKVKEAGMDYHLSKPIEPDKLFGCIAEMLHLSIRQIKKQILVVDDIETNRVVIKEALIPEFDVYDAKDGFEAMEILKKVKGIDIVITDIQMPGMGGIELIKSIRSKPEYNHISIIANTQFGDPEQEEEILALGASDFVYKPTTPKIIELRVRNTLNRI